MTADRDIHLDDPTLQALAGGAGPDDARAHLDACGRCQAEVAAWRGLFADLEALPLPEPDTAFAGEVLARLDAEWQPEPVWPRGVWLPLGVAAGFAVLAGLVAAFGLDASALASAGADLARSAVGAFKLQVLLRQLVAALPEGTGAVVLAGQIVLLALCAAVLKRLLETGVETDPEELEDAHSPA